LTRSSPDSRLSGRIASRQTIQELKQEIESLRELREIAGKAQLAVATALNIKQPSVSKIERQTDMYLSTLQSYVEAIGGRLELTVKLPERPTLRIRRLGDVAEPAVQPRTTRSTRTYPGSD